MKNNKNRREFIKKSALALGALTVIPSHVIFAKPELRDKNGTLIRRASVPPSDRFNMVVIGCGGQGRGDLYWFFKHNTPIQMIAACDVDEKHAAMAKQMADEKHGNKDCRVYKNYRELLEKEKPDAAILALPDHWHARIACDVADKKIHIYGEKPLARTIKEGRAIVNAVERNNIIWQMGSWQRSKPHFRHACELVINGRIGEVIYVEVGLPNGGQYIGNPLSQAVPEGLDWNMWLGPAPEVPYRGVAHNDWRWINDYGGGQLTDWAGHHIDIAHWGLGFDKTGPIAVEGKGRRNPDGLYDVFAEYDFMCEYENGVKIRVANNKQLEYGGGIHFVGSEGWIHVDRGRIEASDEKILKEVIGEDEIKLYVSRTQEVNFIECVAQGKETICPAETGQRSISVGLLGEIAMTTGEKLHWNPKEEKFINNSDQATRLLERPYRAPWKLPQ